MPAKDGLPAPHAQLHSATASTHLRARRFPPGRRPKNETEPQVEARIADLAGSGAIRGGRSSMGAIEEPSIACATRLQAPTAHPGNGHAGNGSNGRSAQAAETSGIRIGELESASTVPRGSLGRARVRGALHLVNAHARAASDPALNQTHRAKAGGRAASPFAGAGRENRERSSRGGTVITTLTFFFLGLPMGQTIGKAAAAPDKNRIRATHIFPSNEDRENRNYRRRSRGRRTNAHVRRSAMAIASTRESARAVSIGSVIIGAA
jgi:hypothetical protein